MSLLKLKTKEAKTLVNCHASDDNVISNVDSDSDHSEIFRKNNNKENNYRFSTLALRMLNFCRELAIFCLVMMTYAALSKDPPKISKSPAAYQFFSKESIVTDWYQGQISKAIENARSSDIVFVMFYAPWDADSQKGRKEFEKAAQYMQGNVNFIAVNCWQPLGECRTQYNKVYKWPVLIAYLPHGRGVQYNGPLSAPHIVQFLKKVCNPIKRVGTNDLKDFQDVYIRAELDASPGSLDFAVFYTASLRYLERDPQFRITFYISPSSISPPNLYLYLWNETLVFPSHELSWTPDHILQWLFKSTHQITSWVLPSGSKSIALSSIIQNGPALILFTPNNPLHNNNDYYNLLQEIAHEYHTCKENSFASVFAAHLRLKRTANFLMHKQLKTLCTLSAKLGNKKIISHKNPVWANASACSQNIKRENCDLLVNQNFAHICVHLKTENCFEFFPKITNKYACRDEIGNTEKPYKTSILTGMGDRRSAENLEKIFETERCKQFLEAEKHSPAIFVKTDSIPKNISFAGMSCRSNKSLTMLAMDSLLYDQFALRLGINLSIEPDRSAAVILNDKMESHYILRKPITSNSLKEFISSFTRNNLNRSFSSSATLLPPPEKKKENLSQIIVKELDTDTFLPTVLHQDHTVVVFYYSKQCSFCNGVSYIFLTVAKKLALLKSLVFARIDGDINILPWEYTMETYPTILFFPSKRKSESRVFPSGISITVSNIISFLLVNLEPNLKLQALWYLCMQTTPAKEQSSCYSTLLGETLNLIDSTLKEWRKSHTMHRQILLHRLKSLRQLHLLFAHAHENQSEIVSYLKKIDSTLRHTDDFNNPKSSRSILDEL